MPEVNHWLHVGVCQEHFQPRRWNNKSHFSHDGLSEKEANTLRPARFMFDYLSFCRGEEEMDGTLFINAQKSGDTHRGEICVLFTHKWTAGFLVTRASVISHAFYAEVWVFGSEQLHFVAPSLLRCFFQG
jgi:hypothetical protein